jgi:type IV pilus assembly protein PilV
MNAATDLTRSRSGTGAAATPLGLAATRRGRRIAGITLFEALIAVLVASVGLIGAARLQTVGLRMTTASQLRQKAVLLTYQMTDRIRANRAGYSAGGYDNPSSGPTACLATGCTPAQLAVADVTEWRDDVARQLPGGEGVVCVDDTPEDGSAAATPDCSGSGDVLAVKVWWTDAGGTTRFATLVRP